VFVAVAGPAAAAVACDQPDPTHGFTVLVQGDASLAGSEIEGTIGVGGALSWESTYDVRHSTGLTPPDYDLPTVDVGGTDLPVRVAAGSYDLAGSQGVLQVGSGADNPAWPRGEMLAGAVTWTTSALQGEEVFVGDGTSQARVLSPTPPSASDDLAAWIAGHIGPVDVSSVTDGFTTLDQVVDFADRLTGADDGVSEVTLAGGPSEKQLELVAGDINVLSLTPEQFEGTAAVKFTGAVPGPGTYLMLQMSGGTSFTIPRFDGANDSGQNNVYAPYVLWTYPESGPLTVTGSDRFTGSLLAPRADVTLQVASPFEGQLVAANLTKVNGSGEIHHYPFAGCVPDDLNEVGNVALSKTLDLDGTFTRLPFDVQVRYWIDGVLQQPDLNVPVDGTQLGPVAVPAGTLIELGELPPPAVAGGVWGDPVWDVSGTTTVPPTEDGAEVAFVVGADDEITLNVTNVLHGQGRFSVQKSADDAGLGSPDAFAFQWWVDDVRQSPDLEVASDGTVLGPIDVAPDSVVELREVAPADPTGGSWNDPTWEVSGADEATATHGGYAFTVGRGSAVSAVEVTNVAEADEVSATGGFAVRKVVAGPGAPESGTFTGTWTCDAPNADGDADGTWRVAAGETAEVDGFPAGTECTVAEDATQPGGAFSAALAPADGRVVVAAGEPVTVTVTNTYPAPDDGGTPGPGDLANSGPQGVGPLAALALVALLVGAGLVAAGARRRA